MIKKVISGGQTGADIAGLKAAKHCNIETGGMMPKGFYTEKGRKPEYLETYGLVEDREFGYNNRTEQNVISSDGTIIFATNFKSPGTKITINYCKKWNKPKVLIDVSTSIGKDATISERTYDIGEMVKFIIDWIKKNNIEVLNVAGNRESKAPGIEICVEKFLVEVFNKTNSEG